MTLISDARAIFDEATYREPDVARCLGLPVVAALAPDRVPALRAAFEDRTDSLATLVRLFLLEVPVARSAAERALGREAVGILVRAKLLAPPTSQSVSARVALYPCDPAVIATDLRFAGRLKAAERRRQVMYLGADSYLLAHLIPDPPADGLVIDLCTGSGVQGIVAACRGATVIGTDVNSRAVAFATFNAALNGVADRCTFLAGDLFQPITGPAAQNAGLILANPPFVPGPLPGPPGVLFRDGGVDGEDVLRRIVTGAPSRIAAGGIVVIVSAFMDRAGMSFEDRLSGWLGQGSTISPLWLVTDDATPEAFARAHAADDRDDVQAGYRRRVDALRVRQIERVRGGLLVLCPRGWGGSPDWPTIRIDAPRQADRSAVPRLLAACRAAARLRRDGPEGAVLRLGAGTSLRPLAPSSGSARARPAAHLVGPLGIAREVSPPLQAVLQALDGRRVLGLALRDAAIALRVSPRALAVRLEPSLIDLVALGLLEPQDASDG